ncbi:hypothetical protein BAUCODRAFT_23342 [Baudoinia panamericana UAMH 10762]|uniref:Uncharacterized protein n=1 Tax=Baudoinia panamericana (strain UAMH 10762) TaxID=717646 RepID=M2MZ84_BAUPA|nr:uncharacterized protein BAUCODRAFT_23342 [Baudoinia panamericana UAMH 10762]EMC96923.1 hypothetical protein BAUCODRAFT_23342 [Baudoinia panamericana UAMH 10762]
MLCISTHLTAVCAVLHACFLASPKAIFRRVAHVSASRKDTGMVFLRYEYVSMYEFCLPDKGHLLVGESLDGHPGRRKSSTAQQCARWLSFEEVLVYAGFGLALALMTMLCEMGNAPRLLTGETLFDGRNSSNAPKPMPKDDYFPGRASESIMRWCHGRGVRDRTCFS